MKNDRINKYIIVMSCTYYNKYNVPRPMFSGRFEYEITEEFIGDELQAAEHFNSKYNRDCESKNSLTKFQVKDIYKVIQEGGSKHGC